MAQAGYTDPNARSKRHAAKLQEQARANIAARPSAGIADGIQQAGTATQAEYDQAVERQKAARAPAQARPIAASTISPAEAASFNQQSGGRFGQQFPQAPTVANAQARTNMGGVPRPTATPGIGAGLVPPTAPTMSRAGQIGQRAGQAFTTAANSRVGRGLRVGGTVAGVGMEALDVARVIGDERNGAAEIGTQVAEGAGKLAAAGLGAQAGAALGAFGGPLAPITVPLGGIAGGIAGYMGGEELIERGREFFGSDPDSPAERTMAGAQAQPGAGAIQPADFSGVRTSVDTTASTAQQRQQANGGITPIDDRSGAGSEVLGTFQGRPITRADSDQRATSVGSFGGAPAVSDGLIAPARAQQPAFREGNPGGGAAERVKDITDSSTKAGQLYARLSEDKTPSGKRAAAAFLSEYLGTGTAERAQDSSMGAGRNNDAASLQRGRESDATTLQRGRESDAANKTDRSQYVFNDDGSVGRISDGVLSDVVGTDGKPVKGKGKKGSAMDQEELITERLNQIDPGNTMTPEERQMERNKVLAELAQLSEAIGGGA